MNRRRPIDYKALREIAPPRAVLELIGWNPTEDRGKICRGRCPLETPPHRGSRCLWVTPTGWYCHVCHCHGDAADLYRRLARVEVYEAAVALCRLLGVAVPYR